MNNEPRSPETLALFAAWKSPEYAARVRELESEGMTNSDATDIADMEVITSFRTNGSK